jgi:hypothetical protein
MGWGIGILFHAAMVFVGGHGQSLRDRMTAAEMKKMNSPHPQR